MGDTPRLWLSGGRKEAVELMRNVWSKGGPEIRARLAEAIVAGPPERLLARIGEEQRESSRDRRIFDRLVVLERAGTAPLGALLESELLRLRQAHPRWQSPEGEQLHFATWMETRSGPETDYGVDDLKRMDDGELIRVLLETQERREGLLDAWRQLGEIDPQRVIGVLDALTRLDGTAIDVWVHALWGLRQTASQPSLTSQVLALLYQTPSSVLGDLEMSRAVADLLAVTAASSTSFDDSFWLVYDRITPVVERDPANADLPTERDWVTLALNRSVGKLGIAFFSALVARRLIVGGGIPADLRRRLDDLVVFDRPSHRLARVIAASRLSYLFAVDPDWTQTHLIPRFNWDANPDEALAVWQGFAWQPRIDRTLWEALRPHFLEVFTPKHVSTIGDSGRTLAQILMLVGIEFGPNELNRDGVRNALRAMSDEMRSHALAWIVSFLEQEREEVQRNEAEASEGNSHPTDLLWAGKVGPWLTKVWPPEPALRTAATAEQFALISIATRDSFPDAVNALVPFMVPSEVFQAVDRLADSAHPDEHPEATLKLVDAVVSPHTPWLVTELKTIFDRLLAAKPQLAGLATFRVWSNRLRTL